MARWNCVKFSDHLSLSILRCRLCSNEKTRSTSRDAGVASVWRIHSSSPPSLDSCATFHAMTRPIAFLPTKKLTNFDLFFFFTKIWPILTFFLPKIDQFWPFFLPKLGQFWLLNTKMFTWKPKIDFKIRCFEKLLPFNPQIWSILTLKTKLFLKKSTFFCNQVECGCPNDIPMPSSGFQWVLMGSSGFQWFPVGSNGF